MALAVLAGGAQGQGEAGQPGSPAAPEARPTPEGRETPAALTWERGIGAEGCIGPDALVDALNESLGAPLVGLSGQPHLVIAGSIERVNGSEGGAEGAFHAHIDVRGSDGIPLGDRTVSAATDDCRDLDEAITVIAVLILEPHRRELEAAVVGPPEEPDETRGGEREEEGGDGPRPSSGPGPEAPPPLAPADPSGARIAVALGLGLLAGLLPDVAPSPALRGAVGAGHWVAEVGLSYAPPQFLTAPGGVGAVDLSALLSHAMACGSWPEGGRWSVGVCGGLEVGGLFVSPSGFNDGQTATTLLLVNGTARLRGLLRPARVLPPAFVLGIEVGASVPFIRDVVRYEDVTGGGTLFQVSEVIAVASLLAAAEF